MSSLSEDQKGIVDAFAASFRKMHAMDFYITKYQGKMMQSLTPLFDSLSKGIRKLIQEQKEADQQSIQSCLENTCEENPPQEHIAEKSKTAEDVRKLARQKRIRMLSMANRCYWMSSTELAINILTGGRTLTSHKFHATASGVAQPAMPKSS